MLCPYQEEPFNEHSEQIDKQQMSKWSCCLWANRWYTIETAAVVLLTTAPDSRLSAREKVSKFWANKISNKLGDDKRRELNRDGKVWVERFACLLTELYLSTLEQSLHLLLHIPQSERWRQCQQTGDDRLAAEETVHKSITFFKHSPSLQAILFTHCFHFYCSNLLGLLPVI